MRPRQSEIDGHFAGRWRTPRRIVGFMEFSCKELAFSCEVGTKKIDQTKEVEQLARSRNRACRRRQRYGPPARDSREGQKYAVGAFGNCRSFGHFSRS